MRPDQRHNQVGIDRFICLNWLEHTARLCLAGNEAPTVKVALQEYLKGAFRCDATKVRNSLDKTITILMKIWVRPPSHLCQLQHEGLKLISQLPCEEHIAVHWGQVCAVYPFWGAIAANVGRLLRLQRTVTAAQVQRRMQEQYGERDTVFRATRRVLQSFVDWGVLKEPPEEKGVYTPGVSLPLNRIELIAWLTEAFLHAHQNSSVPLGTILNSTSFFPFALSSISADQLVAASRQLSILRNGLDQDFIMLVKRL